MAHDLRKYASQTRFRLVIGFIIVLFLVGLGLIWRLYGRNAAFLGLLCILGALVPLGLIALAILGMDTLAKWIDRE